MAQKVGRAITLLFHDRDRRSGWVVSSRTRPHFTPGKDPVPILYEAGLYPRAGLDWREISSPPGFDPGPTSPLPAAIPTELPGPLTRVHMNFLMRVTDTVKLKGLDFAPESPCIMTYLSLKFRVTFPFVFPSCHILRLIVTHTQLIRQKKNFHEQS